MLPECYSKIKKHSVTLCFYRTVLTVRLKCQIFYVLYALSALTNQEKCDSKHRIFRIISFGLF